MVRAWSFAVLLCACVAAVCLLAGSYGCGRPCPTEPGATAVICAIAKDEEAYIDEWIAYHLKLGFDAIYVYDNSDTCTLRRLPDAWGDRVRVIHFPGKACQMPAYDNFIATYKHAHTWAAFLDVDEFVVLRKHPDIKSLLRERCCCGALCLNWLLFGSSGHAEYAPEPVLKRFQRRDARPNPHVKSIVRLRDAVVMTNAHAPALTMGRWARDTSGRAVAGALHHQGPSDVAAVHHYFTKSRGEFAAKRARGRSDNGAVRDAAEFDHHDLNHVHDSSAWDFARA